jgi:signal-transduction protein with cAMP-binding, CBS, and nucleotidyltransferase domain
MKQHGIGGLIVTDENNLLGILSDKDIVRRVIASKQDPKKIKARDIMVKDVITISPEKDIYDALIKMKERDIRHLPVTNKNEMIGLLTLKDILKIQPELFELMVEKYELREESRKPVFSGKISEGICEGCGFPSTHLTEIEGSFLCRKCAKKGHI